MNAPMARGQASLAKAECETAKRETARDLRYRVVSTLPAHANRYGRFEALARVRHSEILWTPKSLCTNHLILCALPVCHYRIFR